MTVHSPFGKYRRCVVKSENAPVVTGTLPNYSVSVGSDSEAANAV